MEARKNLCAMLPVTLHTRVRQEQEKAGMTLGEYVEAMITEYYDWKDGKIMTGEMRTLAAQIPAELFDRLDRYLKERGIKKKDFLVDIITRALEEAEASEVTETITETPPNDDGEAILHDEPDEQPEADEI
ncbi:MAG: 4-oxalocrotonate tautomerase [Oscillospiraceae bacterium]